MNEELARLRETLRKIAELAASVAAPTGLAGQPADLSGFKVCKPKSLPKHQLVAAANRAVEINPTNQPPVARLRSMAPGIELTQERIAVLTSKRWRSTGVRLTVGFLDIDAADLRARIVSHMNAWSDSANVQFVQTTTDPQVRIATKPGDGHWSYVGTDILGIPADEPTMNLDSFSMNTLESEYVRVVRHETGHTLGFPHEHMRGDLVARIEPAKAIAYFAQTQGWSEDEVRNQVLTPLEDSSLLGTLHADQNSIMCYQIPGTITTDGQPILGGLDIDASDRKFAASIYPKPNMV